MPSEPFKNRAKTEKKDIGLYQTNRPVTAIVCGAGRDWQGQSLEGVMCKKYLKIDHIFFGRDIY